jgi:hypothetical protein
VKYTSCLADLLAPKKTNLTSRVLTAYSLKNKEVPAASYSTKNLSATVFSLGVS